jgi:hypothetical protein
LVCSGRLAGYLEREPMSREHVVMIAVLAASAIAGMYLISMWVSVLL